MSHPYLKNNLKNSKVDGLRSSKHIHAYEPPDAILESVLYCEELDSCSHFYENILGLTLFSHQPGRHRFYRLSTGMLLLFCAKATSSETITISGNEIPKHGAEGSGHLAFAVPANQLKGIRDRLLSFGVAIESEVSWPSGGQSIYCRDPAGNSIEFVTPELWFGEH